MSNKPYQTPVTIFTEEVVFRIFDTREATDRWSVEASARCEDGIMYLQEVYSGDVAPNAELVLDEALTHGIFSPRPVRLDECIDPSMSHCVLVLLVRFCQIRGISLRQLFERTEALRGLPTLVSLASSILQGLWEGVVIPAEWSAAITEALLNALSDVGWEDIADFLERELLPPR